MGDPDICMSRILSPTVEFLSKTFPAFHYVVGDDGSTLANNAADAALPAAPQIKMRSRRRSRAPPRGRLGMSKSPDDGGVSDRGVVAVVRWVHVVVWFQGACAFGCPWWDRFLPSPRVVGMPADGAPPFGAGPSSYRTAGPLL